MKKRIVIALMLAAAVFLLTGCGGLGKEVSALEKSGILEHFFGDYYPETPFGKDTRSCAVNPDRTLDNTDGNGGKKYEECKIVEPVYVVKYRDDILGLKSRGFTSATAEGGSYSDPDALTKGTLVFMASRGGSTKVYHDEKQRTVVGEVESMTVYLYNIEAGVIFDERTFQGDALANQYTKAMGTEAFVNSVHMDEVNEWIDSHR